MNHHKPIPLIPHVFSCLRLFQLRWRLHCHPRPQQCAIGHVAHGPVRAGLGLRAPLSLGEGRGPEARVLVTSVVADWDPGSWKKGLVQNECEKVGLTSCFF